MKNSKIFDTHLKVGDDLLNFKNETLFIKIDVEGFEFEVLKGFGNMLSEKAIKIIQFEYGYANADAGHTLKDIFNFLIKIRLFSGFLDLKHHLFSFGDIFFESF